MCSCCVYQSPGGVAAGEEGPADGSSEGKLRVAIPWWWVLLLIILGALILILLIIILIIILWHWSVYHTYTHQRF